jgi:abhydrolase domain-containing protein 12
MPWYETEELFKTTTTAADQNGSSGNTVQGEITFVDLGEAGRQEVWQRGPHYISKTIAKHGGTYSCEAVVGLAARPLGYRFADLKIMSICRVLGYSPQLDFTVRCAIF